uniref:Ig-like domain-containing protein n=1 Tax=Echeneis naucrates TaxID=173247 RepID=A0A665TF87_ECHNA
MTVSWLKDNHELKEAENIQITYENRTALLHITNLQSKHGGKYSCQAQNQAGSQTCSAVLTVKGLFKILKMVKDSSSYTCIAKNKAGTVHCTADSKKPESMNVLPGSKVQFNVLLSGTPALTIKWFKDKKEIVTDGHNYKRSFSDSVAVLELLSASFDDDGVYTCEAQNDAGSVSCSSTLSVKGQPLSFYAV